MAKSKRPAAVTPEKVARARRDGHPEKAVDLARQLYRQSPTEANRGLLRDATMEHAVILQLTGRFRDAAKVYAGAVDLGTEPAFFQTLAERLAACGELDQALALLPRTPDPERGRPKVLGHAADYALQQGPAGRAALPAEHHPALELIEQAFGHSDAGRDEEARAALQGVGLQSPLLDWKVFLRGLLAYYAGDDARALENWNRLDPPRLAYRLSAPLRFRIDPTYRAAQSGPAQAVLQTAAARLHGSEVLRALNELRPALNAENLAPAYRLAEKVLPALKRDFPSLVSRLADCFFWAVVDHGRPEDVARQARVFGPPADDPRLLRLQALAYEVRGQLADAHQTWQDLAKDIAGNAVAWPGEVGRRAQALVWARMGENAQDAPRRVGPEDLFGAFFGGPRAAPQPLKPSAEECYRRSLKLAPERLDAYLELFDLHRRDKKADKAKEVGRQLLDRFPDHVATLEALGDLCLEGKAVAEARDYYEKALRANPLERRLRGKLARAVQNLALERTLANQFDEARALYQQALALAEGPKGPLLYQWAAGEMKAKDPDRVAELLRQAEAAPDQRLAARYALVGEGVRAKLPPARRKELADQLQAALAERPTPGEVLALLEVAAGQREAHLDAFRGQKTHERNFLKFLEAIPLEAFDEGQLGRLCDGLQALQARKAWEACLRGAEARFSGSLHFRLSWADFCLTGPSADRRTFLARDHLDRARKLAEALPRGEAQQQWLEKIGQREERLRALGDAGGGMFDALDAFFNAQFGGDEDDEG